MLFIRNTVVASVVSLSLFSTICYAEGDYQFEVLGSYEKEDKKSSTDKAMFIGAEIFFEPVNTGNRPLAVASFLDKKSSIGIGYVSSETKLINSSIFSFDTKGSLIGINYVTDEEAFILGATYTDLDGDTNPVSQILDGNSFSVSLGKYMDDSTTVIASHSSTDLDYTSTTPSQAFVVEIDRYELEYVTINKLGATDYYGYGVGVEFIRRDHSIVGKEDNTEFQIGGGYYFSRMTSLDAEISFNSGDDVSSEGRTLEIGFTHFVTPNIALDIEFVKFSAEDSNTEKSDSLSLAVIARI